MGITYRRILLNIVSRTVNLYVFIISTEKIVFVLSYTNAF